MTTTFRYPPMLAFEALEDHLGPPEPARTARLDEDESFPAAELDRLRSFGLHRYYVPARHGGLLRDYESAVALIRAVAGRDLTVAIAHGKTFLGSVSVWVAGDERQADRLAAEVGAGRAVAWGLTERAHGSDLLGGDLTAVEDPGGVRLDGEKWLINNATQGEFVCVLARSDPGGGPRGFSMYLVAKDQLEEGAFEPLPKVHTAGIRGADISGFRLTGAVVAPEDRVGPAGHGLETVLKAMQLTRTLCSALSLGAADHALREVTGFAESRVLYGQPLVELPAAARSLAECYADHLLNEAFATVTTRSIQALPADLSVLSAAVKYLVPVRTEELITRLRRLLGARAWLRDVPAAGQGGDPLTPGAGEFQKIERDHRIVSVFDGNTVVNLNSLISQFPAIVRSRRRRNTPAPGFRACADLSDLLPELDRGRLRLAVHTGPSLLHSIDDAVRRLDDLAATEPGLAPHARAVRLLSERTDDLIGRMSLPITPPDVPAEAFHLADRLTQVLAGAAAVALWLENRELLDDGDSSSPWRDGCWLLAALDRVERALDTEDVAAEFTDPEPDQDAGSRELAYASLLGTLREQVRSGRLTSLLPARLGGAV